MANPRRRRVRLLDSPPPLPRTNWQTWLERHNACIRGRRWVGPLSAAQTWQKLSNRSDMGWLIWKLTEGVATNTHQAFFTHNAGEFLTTLAHRAGCDAVRAMVPWLPAFKYGEFQGWSKAQRDYLGRLAWHGRWIRSRRLTDRTRCSCKQSVQYSAASFPFHRSHSTEEQPPMAPTSQQWDDLIKAFADATTAIGTRIQKLVDEIAAGGLTAEAEQAKFDAIKVQTDRLIEMGTDPANPVPAPTPEPVPAPGEEPPATPGTEPS
jgi:hypothetical protein